MISRRAALPQAATDCGGWHAGHNGGDGLDLGQATCGDAWAYDHHGDNSLLWGSTTNFEELFHALSSNRRRFRCSHANSGRIKPRRRSRLSLLPERSRLGLAGPLPFLDLRTMLGDRIWHPLVLWDQPALRLCAAAARLLATLLTQRSLGTSGWELSPPGASATFVRPVAPTAARRPHWPSSCRREPNDIRNIRYLREENP